VTLLLPSLHDRVSELEDQVFKIYDWTHVADERTEQQKNRLDFLAQCVRDVKTTVDKIDGDVAELLRLARATPGG
jgi:hypothetical protein